MSAPESRLGHAQAVAEAWNRNIPIGTSCSLVDDYCRIVETRTRSRATASLTRGAVVFVERVPGGPGVAVALERIIPHVAQGASS